jgi:hypothetical protein
MSSSPANGAQLAARLRYASGDNAADRRVDALALRSKLRREYERRPVDQDKLECARCGKPLVRCLARTDVTNCYYHRGELCDGRARRVPGAPRWSCCHLAADSTGCQLGGRHSYVAVHPTFDSWFASWATTTGQGIARDQVRQAAVLDRSTNGHACDDDDAADGHHCLPPRVRWVLTCQRAAWVRCQHRRLGQGSPAYGLSPDLVAQVARSMPEPSVHAVRSHLAILMRSAMTSTGITIDD